MSSTSSSTRFRPRFAGRLASALRVAVLYPAVETVPSAYWVAGPSGGTARARLLSSDGEPPVHTIDAVASPVAELPHVPVSELPEIVRELRANQGDAD